MLTVCIRTFSKFIAQQNNSFFSKYPNILYFNSVIPKTPIYLVKNHLFKDSCSCKI